METTDKTLLEMQQQLQQLKKKLDSQKIVNDNILRNSLRKGLFRLRIKSNVPVIAAFAIIMMAPFIYNFGFSIYFVVFTVLLIVAAAIASLVNNWRLPRMDSDLVRQTTDLIKFRKVYADWIKYSLPALAIWIIWFLIEVFTSMGFNDDMKLGIITGAACGLVIGMLLGLKNRRDILGGVDEMLSHIDDLTNNL